MKSSGNIDSLSYIFFSLSFFALLFISFLKPISAFLTLTNIFLFMGFWLKASGFIITSRLRGDFVGAFNTSAFNTSLISAGLGGLLLTILQFLVKKRTIQNYLQKNSYKIKLPHIYNVIFLMIVLLISFLNFHYSFFQVGIVSGLTLFMPLSLAIYWFLGPGAAFFTFLISTSKYSIRSTTIIILTMLAISTSTISRNTLLYFAFPVFVKFIYNLKNLKLAILHTAVIGSFFLISLFIISQLRRSYYYPETVTATSTNSIKEINAPVINWNYTKGSTSQVFLDRWIGFEGVLVGNMNQSDSNFKTLITEDAKVNRVSLYSKLSGSFYPTTGKYLFYTLPGPLGLISFAQSLPVKVFAWFTYLFIIFLCYLIIEKYFFGYAKMSISWWAASSMTQLSLFPIYNLKIFFTYLFMMYICIFVLVKIGFIIKTEK